MYSHWCFLSDGLKNNEPKLDAGVSEPQSTEKSSDSNHPPDAEEQQLVPVAIKVYECDVTQLKIFVKTYLFMFDAVTSVSMLI